LPASIESRPKGVIRKRDEKKYPVYECSKTFKRTVYVQANFDEEESEGAFSGPGGEKVGDPGGMGKRWCFTPLGVGGLQNRFFGWTGIGSALRLGGGKGQPKARAGWGGHLESKTPTLSFLSKKKGHFKKSKGKKKQKFNRLLQQGKKKGGD